MALEFVRPEGAYHGRKPCISAAMMQKEIPPVRKRRPFKISAVELPAYWVRGALCALMTYERVQARHLGDWPLGLIIYSLETDLHARHTDSSVTMILSSAYGDQDAVTAPHLFHTTFLMPLFYIEILSTGSFGWHARAGVCDLSC